MHIQSLKEWLRHTNGLYFSLFAIIAAFSTYACMYAFRKPLAAGEYDAFMLWGMSYKSIILITQILGYTLSKFIGIKVVSEMLGNKRALSILLLIGISELGLLCFAIVPYPFNFIFLLMNGLPLGMIWGLVFSYLEGRRFTDILGAGLSVSFVVSSGFVKSVGKALLNAGLPEFWMPFVTGLIFIAPLVVFVWLLDHLPPPTQQDEALRTKRVPMDNQSRKQFFYLFAPGLVGLVLIYMMLTAFRDFRDNFMADIWAELGVNSSMVFTYTEVPIAIIVLALLGSTMAIRSNIKALMVNNVLVFAGMLLIGLATAAFHQKIISPTLWMTAVGLGGYMAYIPFNCILFDRLISTFRHKSNAGFLIYVADAFGYLSAIVVMLYKEILNPQMSWLAFFTNASYVLAITASLLTIFTMVYFWRKNSIGQMKVKQVKT